MSRVLMLLAESLKCGEQHLWLVHCSKRFRQSKPWR